MSRCFQKGICILLVLACLTGYLPTYTFATEADVSEQSPLSLDSIAWEGLTYRDVFITNNRAYLDGFNNGTFSPFIPNAGTATVTTEACYTGPYSLAAFGSPSQQVKSTDTLPAGDYFIASKVYCTRYAAGELGVCFHSTTVGVTQVTDGFVTASDIISAKTAGRIYIGSIHTADLDGYVDDPVVVNMSIFSKKPSTAELTELYEQYVQIEKARDRQEVLYTEQEMLSAFVTYMNAKADLIGMEDSWFNDPVGMANVTTARDLARLMVYAASKYEDLMPFWSTESHDITVGGINRREETVSCSYYSNPYLQPYYPILGVKGGSLTNGNIRNLAAILQIPNSDDRLAVVALYAEGEGSEANGSRAAVKQVADAAMIKYLDPTADNTNASVCCQSAIAVLIPAEGAQMDQLQILYEKDADSKRKPASISKVLTAICVLDLQKNLSETITYRTVDTEIGGFYVKDFLPGDTVTVEDALYALMLSSSNVTARALGRTLGESLLETGAVSTEQEMLDAFAAYMNEKAAHIGMVNSSFLGPIGTDNITTAQDLLRLMICADGYEELTDVWGKGSYSVKVLGEKAREQVVKSTVIKPALEDYYHILGGKTGTLSQYNARNLAVILEIPNSEDRLAVVALYADGVDTASDNRFAAVKQIADAALAKYYDSSLDNSSTDVCCASAIACLLPAGGVDLDDLRILYEKDSQTQRVPASITKVLTAICALDWINDPKKLLAYTDIDTQIGSYYTRDFYPGDVVSLEDALHAMLLPSSNVTARMVARAAGGQILQRENKLKGKVISILSASTSTFAGWIPEADGFNLAHRARYPQNNLFTDVESTWWHQVITQLDAKLGINDSWAGSQVLNTLDNNSGDLGPDAAMASLTRIQNLGANGKPDVILFFGGGNDIGRGVTLGSFNPETAPTEVDLTATKWESFADAYVAAIMRLQHFYPDTQIVVMMSHKMPSYVTAAKLNKYGPVMKAICEHYGVPYVELHDCGITFDMLPDNIHPNAEGMDYITADVLDTLLNDVNLEAGENVVHPVTHNLTNAQASLHYYKGVSAGEHFVETVSGENVTVTVTMGGVDITSQAYVDGTITIPKVTGELVITAKGAFDADGHLQQLPENVCCNTNLWTALEPELIYYTANGWGNTTAGTTWSITFPVNAGDKIWATSLQAYPQNGSGANGVRVTWFDENGVLLSMSRETVYAEFAAKGYITAPEGAVALNMPMTNNQDHYAVYILNAQHTYENGSCTSCGKLDTYSHFAGKVISVMGDSISTFAGYIPTADGFNLAHRTRYPDTSRIPDVTDVNETWWMQVINELDAKLGVNESWAGSCIYWGDDMTTKNADTGEKAAMASLTRIQNLGSNGTPDLIFLYGGGNDRAKGVKLGSFDPAKVPAKVDLTSNKWDSFADSCVAAIMRMQHFYPNAQIVVLMSRAGEENDYIRLMREICEYFDVPFIFLNEHGLTPAMHPDGSHPNEEGMDVITAAILDVLVDAWSVAPGENTVYTVTHALSNATASRHYYKGVSAGSSFVETISGDDLSLTITMGGVDITSQVYVDGTITIPKVSGDLVITAEGAFNADGHLQQLPGNFCCGTNLWTALEPENIYYTVDGWGLFANSPNVHSITFPVKAGDQVWATSFQKAGTNGNSANATRITWFMEDGSVNSIDRNTVYQEFLAKGYITAPVGAVALNVPMANNNRSNEVYILNAEHCYENGICTGCGKYYVNFQSASISLAGNIAINFYVELGQPILDDESAFMSFTLPDGTTKTAMLSDAEVSVKNGVTRYVFTCEVHAKQMADMVVAQMHLGDGAAVGDSRSYSVVTYAGYIIAHEDQYAAYPSLVNLLKAMLNYGAYSQIHFNYNVSNLANANLNLSLNDVSLQDVEAYRPKRAGSMTGLEITSVALILRSETVLRFYYTLATGCSIEDYNFVVNGQAVRPIYNQDNGRYYVDVTNIAAKDLDREYGVTITNKAGTESLSVIASAMSYVYQVISNPTFFTEDVKDVVKAMYAYNIAANAYFN